MEAMANGAAIVAFAGAAFRDAAEVFDAADRGEATALAAVERAAGYLARGVTMVGSLLDPECVVLAGSVGSRPMLAPLVRAAAAAESIEPLGTYLDVRTSALGRDAGVIGAAALVEVERQ